MGSTALGRGGGQCKGGLTGLREESNCDAVTKGDLVGPPGSNGSQVALVECSEDLRQDGRTFYP